MPTTVVAVRFQRAATFMALGAALLELVAALLVSHDIRVMEEGCGSSGVSGISGMGSDLPMIGHGGTLPMVQGDPVLDVEDYILQDNEFMEEHTMNMEVLLLLHNG
jgi:hypothetical protein